MEHVYSAGIITYKTDNDKIEYLILHYADGHWDMPKGKMEPGETKQETAHRELMEETGLTAQLHDDFEETIQYVFLNYDKKIAQKTAYFFIGRTTNSSISLSHEHTDYQWLSYKDAIETLTYENAKNILKKAHKHIISLKDSQ